MAILHTGNHSSALGSVPDLNGSLATDHFNNFLQGHIPRQSCELAGGLRTMHLNILFHPSTYIRLRHHRSTAAATAQEWPRGATPRPRSGEAADRSYLTSKVRSKVCALLEQL